MRNFSTDANLQKKQASILKLGPGFSSAHFEAFLQSFFPGLVGTVRSFENDAYGSRCQYIPIVIFWISSQHAGSSKMVPSII
jgi:hypothetical protein